MEERIFEDIVWDMIKAYPNDYELGNKYREFSMDRFGFNYDGLLKSFPNNMDLGKEVRKIYSKKEKGKKTI